MGNSVTAGIGWLERNHLGVMVRGADAAKSFSWDMLSVEEIYCSILDEPASTPPTDPLSAAVEAH